MILNAGDRRVPVVTGGRIVRIDADVVLLREVSEANDKPGPSLN
jgi:hypothetical protein